MVSFLTILFLGKSPEVNLPVHVLSAHFSPVSGILLFLKQLIPKREIDLNKILCQTRRLTTGQLFAMHTRYRLS